MDVDIHFSEHHVTVRCEGKAEVEDFAAIHRELFDDPRWRPDLSILFDYRKVDERELSAQDVYAVTQMTRDKLSALRGGRYAFVIASALGYGMIRMYEQYLDAAKLETKIFQELEEAEAWLRDR